MSICGNLRERFHGEGFSDLGRDDIGAMALQEFAQFDSEAQGRGIFCGRSSRWPGVGEHAEHLPEVFTFIR